MEYLQFSIVIAVFVLLLIVIKGLRKYRSEISWRFERHKRVLNSLVEISNEKLGTNIKKVD